MVSTGACRLEAKRPFTLQAKQRNATAVTLISELSTYVMLAYSLLSKVRALPCPVLKISHAELWSGPSWS